MKTFEQYRSKMTNQERIALDSYLNHEEYDPLYLKCALNRNTLDDVPCVYVKFDSPPDYPYFVFSEGSRFSLNYSDLLDTNVDIPQYILQIDLTTQHRGVYIGGNNEEFIFPYTTECEVTNESEHIPELNATIYKSIRTDETMKFKTFLQFLEEQSEASLNLDADFPSIIFENCNYSQLDEGHLAYDWSFHSPDVSTSEREHLAIRDQHVKTLLEHPNMQEAVLKYVHAGKLCNHETGSSELSKFLHQCHKENKPVPEHFTFKSNSEHNDIPFHIPSMDAAVKSHTLPYDLKTYSGVGFDPSEHMSGTRVVKYPAYMSSSPSRSVVSKYAKNVNGVHHIVEIQHRKGQHGLYIGNHPDVTIYKQNEFITPRNIHLKFGQDHEHETHHDDQGNEYKIWKATRLS